MSVTIRLARIGKRNAPAFKVVVANTRDKRNGKFLDILGHYNPSHNPVLLDIDKAKVEEWQKKGALTSDAVTKLVEGTYKWEPYTRQNETSKEKKAPSDQPEQMEEVKKETTKPEEPPQSDPAESPKEQKE